MRIALSLILVLAPFAAVFGQAKEGTRTKEEFIKYVAKRLGTDDAEFLDKVFKAIDTDGDGKVSAEEFAKRREAMRKVRGGGSGRGRGASKPPEEGDDKEADFLAHSRRAAPRDAFAVLDRPKMSKAAAAKLSNAEPVIGVLVGGEARAYTVAVMGRHELANDVCGKVPIAVSW